MARLRMGYLLRRGANLADLIDKAAARLNLGLGSAATKNDDRYTHRANNLNDVSSAAGARDNLGLGTAAVRAVGNGAGNVMEVGAFGLGGGAVNLQGQDFNTVLATGFYRSQSSPNSPTGGHSWDYLLVIAHSSSYVMQQAWDFGSAVRSWVRVLENDTWGGWVELYHSGNLDPSLYAQKGNNLADLVDVPTARGNLGLGSAALYNDARYLRQDVTGSIDGGLIVKGNYRVRSSGNRHLWFEGDTGKEQGLVWHDAANGRMRMRVRNGQAGNLAELELRGDGTARVNGFLVWHAGNDGSGSGLHADLLDGQHGSYYRDLDNAFGRLPGTSMPEAGGTVGTYVLASTNNGAALNLGDTIAGGNLNTLAFDGDDFSTAGGTLSGTWRVMGRTVSNAGGSLFMRIA